MLSVFLNSKLFLLEFASAAEIYRGDFIQEYRSIAGAVHPRTEAPLLGPLSDGHNDDPKAASALPASGEASPPSAPPVRPAAEDAHIRPIAACRGVFIWRSTLC